jgi:cysteinyl-tRNA synthetase
LDQDPEIALKAGGAATGPDNEAIEALIIERAEARVAKDFARSDEIRDELTAAGVILEDAGGKTTWRRE